MKISRNIHTFIGCDDEYEDSEIVLFGAPFDNTTSYRPGTRFASSAIRNESFSIETYSPYLDRDLLDISVFDAGDLEFPFGNPNAVLDVIQTHTEKILSDNKLPFMIGGEHLVTLGSVRATHKKYPDLRIIQFDAHADLRDDYMGEGLSHATVMRRCWEILGDDKIFQFGIRSGIKTEFCWAEEHVNMTKFSFDGIDKLTDKLGDNPVYLSIDLDVLDSSVFPGTGTPEAGGVGFLELLQASAIVAKLNVVAIDVNELCPIYDQTGASTSLACKLIRELLLLIANKN